METNGEAAPDAEDGEEDEEKVSFRELVMCFWEEIKNFKKFFNLNDCAEAILLKVFLPANDIISDFLVADKLFQSDNQVVSKWFTFFAYFFIACPGFMFLLSNIQMFRDRLCSSRCHGSLFPFLSMVCFFTMYFLLLYLHPKILLPAAIFVAVVLLLVGMMYIFFHGPYMKKLSALVTGYEGRFESAPQILMHLVLLISGQEFFSTTGLDIYGLCFSLAMLGKDLAENILMNGQNDRLENKTFLGKIAAMGKIVPVIILTAIFRLGTLALAIQHIFVLDCGLLLVPLKFILIVPPAVTILCVRQFYPKIQELSVIECFVGIIGELSAFTIWGKLKPDISRWIQFGLNLYFGILYGVYCVWTVFNPTSPNAELFAIIFLCCGWVAFPLFISQIFFIDTANSVSPENQAANHMEEQSEGFRMPNVDFKIYLI